MARLDERQIATIKRRLRNGEHVETVAADFATTRATLRDHPDIGGYVEARGRHRIVFTDSDRRIARGLAQAGQTNEAIARSLDVSVDTIGRHLADDIARWRAEQLAIAGTGLTRAAGMGSVPACSKILARVETGSWTDRSKVEVDGRIEVDADISIDAQIEVLISQMTGEERDALRIVMNASRRIQGLGEASTTGAERAPKSDATGKSFH